MDVSHCCRVYKQDFERVRSKHPSPCSFCCNIWATFHQLFWPLVFPPPADYIPELQQRRKQAALRPERGTRLPPRCARCHRTHGIHLRKPDLGGPHCFVPPTLPTAGTQMCNESRAVLLCRPKGKNETKQNITTQRFPTAQFTFRRLICFLNRSENSFFLLVPSSSLLLPPSCSSCLQGGTAALASNPAAAAASLSHSASVSLLPFEAVALLAAFVEVGQVAEGPLPFLLLGLGPGAERCRPLQLSPHQFGVPAEVAGPGAVRGFVPEEL